MIEQENCRVHIALSEYAFGADVEKIRRKYGVEARALEIGILQTSAMPVLDSGALSTLEATLFFNMEPKRDQRADDLSCSTKCSLTKDHPEKRRRKGLP